MESVVGSSWIGTNLIVRSCLVAWSGWLFDWACGFLVGSPLFRRSSKLVHKALSFASNFCVWHVVGVTFVLLEQVLTGLPWGWLRLTLRFLVVWLAGACWVLSWALYRRAGTFLGSEGALFVHQNLKEVFQQVLAVEGGQVCQLVCGTGGLVAVWLWGIDRLQGRIPSLATAPLVVLSVAWSLVGADAIIVSLSMHRRLAQTAAPKRAPRLSLALLQRFHTSPLLRVVFGGFMYREATRASPRTLPLELVSSLTDEAKRIAPLSRYVATTTPGSRPRLNVVVILIESLRADRLQLLGATREVMPCLDRLAQRSWVFANAYSQSTHSDYADPCVLSSHYPLRSSNHHYYAPLGYPRVLLPDILQPLGYRTALFSSQNEHWGGMLRYLDTGCWDVMFHAATAGASTYVATLDRCFAKRVQRGLRSHGKLEDDVTVAAALEWIHAHRTEPFFMYLNLQSSHFPYRLPPSVKPTYVPCQIPRPESFVHYPKDMTPLMRNRYDNSLRWIDSLLGRFVQVLESLGMLKHTVLVISGDTGQAFHEHGLTTHASIPWNEVVHVPLVIYAPALETRVIQQNTQHIDVPPSILHLLGLPTHPSFQGLNVFDEGLPVRSLYLTVQSGLAVASATIRGGHKLIYDWQTNTCTLFDLQRDPGERQNLFHDESSIGADLQDRLNRWQTLQLAYYGCPEIHRHYYPPTHD